MYYVYILKSKRTGKYYIGYTNNLEKRLKVHNSGKTKSLVRHIPLEIIQIEEYKFYQEARRREKQIKKYKSGEAFKKLLNSLPTPSAGCSM
ncbi:GIY-YIG nuclease family protein [Candidatus Wolfebacteria bacterium]|nr:GIY-YIG nuclease family protein [Candidatus Wolfebacteria bacterium]